MESQMYPASVVSFSDGNNLGSDSDRATRRGESDSRCRLPMSRELRCCLVRLREELQLMRAKVRAMVVCRDCGKNEIENVAMIGICLLTC